MSLGGDPRKAEVEPRQAAFAGVRADFANGTNVAVCGNQKNQTFGHRALVLTSLERYTNTRDAQKLLERGAFGQHELRGESFVKEEGKQASEFPDVPHVDKARFRLKTAARLFLFSDPPA